MVATSGQPHDTAMRLHGGWLLLARSVWLALAVLSLSARFYAAYLVTAKFLSALVWLVTGAVIFWRKPDERMALFVSLTLVVGGGIAFGGSVDLGAAGSSAWTWVGVVLSFLGNTAIFTFCFVFPDGR